MASRNAASLAHSLREFDAFPDIAFVRQPVVEALYSISAATLWRRVKAGTLPQPRKLSAGVTVWNVGELRTHLKSI